VARTLLFVYGTLKRGCCNQHRLAGQGFVAAARTLPLYRLYRIDWHPGLVATEPGIAVEGELWSVDERTLRQLDEYEGVPEWFDRRPVRLAGNVERAEAYFYQGDVSGKDDCGSVWRE